VSNKIYKYQNLALHTNFIYLQKLEGQIIIFENLGGQFAVFWKFIGVKLKILWTEMQILKNYNNKEF